MKKRKKKNQQFKRAILLYSLITLTLCLFFNIYIYFVLVGYEKHQTVNFLSDYVKNISDKDLKKYLKDAKKDESLLGEYKKAVKSDKVVIEREKDDTYVAKLDDRVLFTIETKVIADKTTLAFFSYQDRKVIKVTPNISRGLVYYDIIVPNNFTIYLDGEKYDAKVSKEDNYKYMDFMYYNNSMPKMATYEINDIKSNKKITVKDQFDNEVKLKNDGYKYYIDEYYITADNFDGVKKYISDVIDVLDVAHKWSLFMTKDLSGSSYGLSTMSKYLISDTDLYKMAYSWTHSIDITFTSKHTLKNPIFTNESVSNCKIYSKSAFSCEVSLIKNMIVKGNDQPDKMHDTLYFIKDNNGAWKFINIVPVDTSKE